MIASVIIITKNQKDHLEKSLPVLLKQNIRGNYEIIVVDSGSTDGAVEYIKNLPKIKLVKINPERFNYANAFNTGAKVAKGKYLVRLSGDVIPTKDSFVSEMIKPFFDPRVGGTFGLYSITKRKGYGYPYWWPKERFPSKLTRYSQTPNPLTGVKIFGLEYKQEETDKVHDFAGACCAVRRNIWEKRPFNESLLAGEDAEYAWFLHLIGYDIVCNPKAKTIHEHKIEKINKNAFRDKYGLTLWQFKYSWNIIKYWFQRAVGLDPYKHLRIN